MRTRRYLSAVLALLAFGALAVLPAQAKAPKAMVVGTDPEGDWGANVDPTLGPIGGPLGQDLVQASIGMADKKTVNFIIKVTSLPSNGGMPEATRYTWNLLVNGKAYELDGKWSNYTRGSCDPTGNACPPPRDPGMQPFLVRGDCASNGAAVACKELGIVQATFDPGAGTITVPVTLAMLKAKPGSKIGSGTQAASGFSGLSATPSAFYSHSAAPYDFLIPTKTFVVPR
jgi:hypothetical protein